MCGITYGWVGCRGEWNSPAGVASLEALAAVGGNWVTLAWSVDQATAHSTHLMREASRTVPDEEIAATVRRAHQLGLKVCLKPVVNCADGTWRAYISFLDPPVPGEPSWDAWFTEYDSFILDAATLAESTGCEMLAVGCEMVMADSQEAHWRSLISRVRQRYSGLVTYNCDKYQEDRVTWWDAVDVISSSGYYPSGAWQENLDRIENVVRHHDKPFCFLEAGCPSRSGSEACPNDWSWQGEPDQVTQATYLEEMLTEISARPFVGGVMLWDWPAHLYGPNEAESNADYCFYGKAGEGVVANHFARLLGRH